MHEGILYNCKIDLYALSLREEYIEKNYIRENSINY